MKHIVLALLVTLVASFLSSVLFFSPQINGSFKEAVSPKATISAQSIVEPSSFVIDGLVENRLNLTYMQLESFPLVSEFAELHCVGSGDGRGGPSVKYVWTGVPLFYLLNLADVIPGTYRKVVFNATDGYSDSVPLDVAMNPTTLIGLKANGTDLRHLSGFGSDYRLVLPGRWGYKWVKLIQQISVVDYNYNGTYESYGDSDDAMRPNMTLAQINPPSFNYTTAWGEIEALTNSSIESFTINHGNQLTFNVTGSEGTSGYFYVIVPRNLLIQPYQVSLDGEPTSYTLTVSNNYAYFWLTYAHSSHIIQINGVGSPSGNSGGGPHSTFRET
jgi:DMSO/TMAO reductase YedYZ molybdopterin-dependent catalytic subunit